MSKIIDRTGKGSNISQAENDSNLESLHGVNQAISGTTHTVTIADQGDTLEFTNVGAVAVTLDDITTILNAAHTEDYKVTLIAVGNGTVVTITPDGSDSFSTGSATIELTENQHITLQSDSTNAIWNVVGSSLNVNVGDTSVKNWTPVVYGVSTAGTPVYSVQTGKYWTVGDTVFATIDMRLTSKGGMVGNLRVSGLPFTCKTPIFSPLLGANFSALGAQYNHIGASVFSGTSIFGLIKYDARDGVGLVTVDTANADDTMQVYGLITYLAN